MAVHPSVQASLDATKVEYRQVGKSGLRVSVPILGAMSIGSIEWRDWVMPEEKALPLLKAAYDRGVNTWDTANIYSHGVSEEIIGKALKQYNIPRHKVVILTKCFGVVGEEPGFNPSPETKQAKDFFNNGGLSRGAIFQAVDDSLKRLGTDYIDLLQIHRFDTTVPLEETMDALHDLVKSGKVRYIGASSMWTYRFVMMQEYAKRVNQTRFISMQNYYNLLYREEEREMNQYCNETGVGLIPWSPLCRGILARPPGSDKTTRSANDKPSFMGYSEIDQQTAKRVHEIAEKKGWPMAHVALAWINKRVSSPIIGFSTVERIDEACGARGKTLTDEEEEYLEELYKARAVEGHR